MFRYRGRTREGEEDAPSGAGEVSFVGRRRARRPSRRARQAFGVLGAGLLVALACVASILAISWFQSSEAVQVVQEQAEAIRQGRVERAYELFSSEYRAEMSLSMFRRLLRRQDQLNGLQDLRIWGRSVWRGTAILWGSFQDDLGHSYPVRYQLIREDGDWRIDSFQLRGVAPESLPNPERFHYI